MVHEHLADILFRHTVIVGRVIEISGMKIVVFAQKLMNRKLLLLLVSVFTYGTILAQTDFIPAKNEKISPRNYAELHLTQPLVNQIHLAYGRFIHPRWSLESEIGAKYKWPTSEMYSIDRAGFWGDLGEELHQMPFANSYYVSLFGVYHFKPITIHSVFDPYLSFGGFYRYSYYRNATIQFEEYEVGRVIRKQSEYHYIPGAKILSGTRIMFPKRSKVKMVWDIYGGLGLRWKRQKEIVPSLYGRADYVNNRSENYISPHFGLKAGVAW